MKAAILAMLTIAVCAAGAFFYLEAQETKRERDAMQSLMVAMNTPEPRDVPVKVIIAYDECNVGDPYSTGRSLYGMDALSYCEMGTSDVLAELESCFYEALRQRNNALYGYGSKDPDSSEYQSLACAISEAFPLKTEDPFDDDLSDPLGSLLGEHLSSK